MTATAQDTSPGAYTDVADTAPPGRLLSLDLVRGLIVAFMALDHTRLFFTSAQFEPTDLNQTNLAYFITRWVTHLCAPGFFFIAGVGAALYLRQTGSKARVSRFLVSRGLWLIALELTVFGFAWSFHPGWFWFGVIAGLGASFLLLAALLHLGRIAVLVLSAAFIILQPVLIGFAVDQDWGAATSLLLTGGVADLPVLGKHIVLYPVLPWFALMGLGYGLAGFLYPRDANARRLLIAGLVFLALFVLLRATGLYGEPPVKAPLSGAMGVGVMAFFNVHKYPPSLHFTLVTLGVLMMAASLLSRFDGRGRLPAGLRVVRTYGQVPFFFYLLHIFLIHGAALAVASLLGWPTTSLFWPGMGPNTDPPDGYGFGIVGVWAAWLVVLALLYPACAWFAGVKRRHPSWWLKYL